MDPRIARTRRSLREALFALARERGLDEISVSDIAERAGVNRSTYYQHYSDKDTLLADALDAVIDEVVGERRTSDVTENEGAEMLFGYLRHVEEHAALYEVLLGENGSATIQVRMANRLQVLLLDAFEGEHAQPPGMAELPTSVAAAALAGAGLATIRAWLGTSPRPSVETAAQWIWITLRSQGTLPR